MTELWQLDATELAQLVGDGVVSARELVEAALVRIERLNPALGCVVDLQAERALAQAEEPLEGPLAGVPILVKDTLPFHLAGGPESAGFPGFRCAFGSRLFAHHRPAEHAAFADAVIASGAIVLGRTTCSEFGLLGSTETLLDGTTHNPWDTTRSATGSSGGSAAAVAAGLVPLAHASDGGGSIRIPAAACGLFGSSHPMAGRCPPMRRATTSPP